MSSNKTRKSPSPKKSHNKSRKSSPSISPNKEFEKLKKDAFNTMLQKDPKSLETFKLFSTNSKYKKQFRYIDELDIKLETLNRKITELEDFASENDLILIDLEERISELNNIEPMKRSVKKQINRIKKEIKPISEKIKKAHDDIEKYELMIEDTEFIREIWISKNIDDSTKQKLTDDYNSFIKVNQSKIDKIQRHIEINKKKSFEKSYPQAKQIVIESPDQIPENSVSVGRDLYLINEDADKFWEFRDKKEIEFRLNMNKWKILNEERNEFKQNIMNAL